MQCKIWDTFRNFYASIKNFLLNMNIYYLIIAEIDLLFMHIIHEISLLNKYFIDFQFFCKNLKNLIFREKFFGAKNYRSKIAVIFFPDRCPVEEHSFRRFLKYLKNHAIFDFFFRFFFTMRVALPFFNPRAGNAWLAITLFFLFQSPSPIKKKMRIFNAIFEKKKSLIVSHALCSDFSDFRSL